MSERAPPSAEVLFSRLRDFNAIGFQGTGDSDDACEAIKRRALEGAICAGAMVNGKWRALRFADYFEALYGRTLEGKSIAKRKVVA